MRPAVMMLGLGPNETSPSEMIFFPTASGERLRPLRHEYVHGLPAVLRLREHIAERDVRQVIAIVIDVEAIDCVGMECVRIEVCIEDDHGSILVGGRLECV